MQALFSAYPGGRPGVALLVLRATLGIAVLLQGASCLGEPGSATATACAEIVCGFLLTVGFLTPFSAILLALSAAVSGFLPAHSCSHAVFKSTCSMVLGGAILVALVLLGPGGISIDAKMFGRREIIIPPTARR